MKHSTWEAYPFSASQKIPCILWKQGSLRPLKMPSTVPILSQINPVHAPHCTSWRSNLILSSHLYLGLASSLFPSGFPHQNPVCTSSLPVHATCPPHLICLDLITRIIFGEEYRSLSSSLCSFLHSCYLVPLRPKYSPQQPILKHLSLRSSLNMSNLVSHPYKATDKIMILHWMTASIPWLNLLFISSWIEIWFITVVPKYLNCSTLPKELLSAFMLWICPAFWSPDMTMYLVLSAFTSSPVSLLATTIASLFLLIVYTLPPNILTPSA